MENITQAMNCSMRYRGNESLVSPTSIYVRHEECNILKTLMPETLMLVRLVMPVWLTVGIFGNTLSFVIWMSRKQRRGNTSAVYLSALSLTDLLVIVLVASYHVDRHYCLPGFNALPGVCNLYQGLSVLTQLYAATLVFGFTLERYIAVCFPFKRHKLCTHKRAMIIVLILLAICSIPMVFQTAMWTFKDGRCVVSEEVQHTKWIQMVMIGQEMIFSLLVPLTTLVLNILVLREMRHLLVRSNKRTSGTPNNLVKANGNDKSRKSSTFSFASSHFTSRPSCTLDDKSRESSSFVSTTLMLVILSFYMIACSLAPGIVFLSQFTWTDPDECLTDAAIHKDPVWKRHIIEIRSKEIIDLLSASHFACNFVIYFLTYKKFRHHALELLTCRKSSNKGDPSLDPYRRRSPRSIHSRSTTFEEEKAHILQTPDSNGSQ